MLFVIENLFQKSVLQPKLMSRFGLASSQFCPLCIKYLLLFRRKHLPKNIENLAIATNLPNSQIKVYQYVAVYVIRDIDVSELTDLREVSNELSASRRKFDLERQVFGKRQRESQIVTDLSGLHAVIEKDGF